jgi:RHS repeat-associated protein
MKEHTASTLALVLCCLLVFGPYAAVAARTNRERPSTNISGRRRLPITGATRPASKAPRGQESEHPLGLLAGQTATLLPNGRFLLIGGEGADGPLSFAELRDLTTGQSRPLKGRLLHARAWHTATLTPDGRVLVLGGIGAGGRILRTAELFEPATQSFRPLPIRLNVSRASHSATLLTDGQILIAGGASEDGALNNAELWDTKTYKTFVVPARMNAARQKHLAKILRDGNVLLEGGNDSRGGEFSSAEIFNPEAQNFSWASGPFEPDPEAVTYLVASLPRDGAADLPVDCRIALRFSKPLRVETVTSETVKLNSSGETVPAKVVPAEGGMLAFITPEKPLESGTTYSLALSGAIDKTNLYVNSAAFSFTTKGEKPEKPSQPDNDPFADETWTPDASNLRGDWRNRHINASAQLPPLRAAESVTAVAGQVLALNGRPLPNVTFRIADKTTQTDDTGRFLLSSIPAGHQVLTIDGETASHPGRVYGLFRVGVEITGGQTNALDYTIWMPKLDIAHATNISSPTASDTVVVNRNIPGLELHLPAGTVVRNVDGENVYQISITPIPTNQPPFPLPPGIDVPVYFTIQPGGSQVIPPRAQLVYPNFTAEKPGTRIDFWNYDPTGKGWYVYGQGSVSADTRQIIPDAGVVLYEFSGAMVASPTIAPPEGPKPCDPSAECNDPVDLSTGLFIYGKTDLALPDTVPIILSRTYRPRDTVSRVFGIGATHTYEIFLVGSIFPYTYVDLILPNGGRVHYDRISPGSGYLDAVYEHTGSPSAFYKSTLSFENYNDRWRLTLKDGTKYYFPDSAGSTTPRYAALTGMTDTNGNSITLTRNSNKNLTRITSPNGRFIDFTYDTANRITKAKDNIGREVNYVYDPSGRLSEVTDANNGITRYTYDTSHNMLTIEDARGNIYLTNQYDASGRVQKQIMADNTPNDPADNPTYQYAYSLGPSGKISQVDVTDPRNNVNRLTFNASGYSLAHTFAVGKPEQQTLTYERQANTNLVLRVTDALSRKTDYAYNSLGDVISRTELATTALAVTTRYAYAPGFNLNFNRLASVTDAIGNTTSFAYDHYGNLTDIVDAIGRHITYTHNQAGQGLSIADALGNKVRFGYEAGQLSSMTDPEGRTLERVVDNAGRVVSTTDAKGNTRRFEYDSVNQLTKITDAQNNVTSFEYDPNGSLLKVTDPRGKITTYTHDKLDRLETRTDFLQGASSVERYEYDKAGNVSRFTDRRGVVTKYEYDNLDRIAFVGFGETPGPTYETTVTYAYDSGNRLHEVEDSASGTITLGYDDLDRLISQITPQGTISYSYDVLDRRQTMTVQGQPTVNYAYDTADRLIRISQGPSVIDFGYDDGDRLTTQQLPNGVLVDYEYNKSAQVTGITYRLGTTVLGDLTYEYDMSGKRVNVGGTFARTNLPSATASLNYNDANQLTQKDTTLYTYDANGNLTFDGSNTYTWDARNQLASISGSQTASFQYDAFGRRINKTINSVSTSYLYDGPSVVQELSGATPFANLLAGDTDTVFSRSEAGGTFVPFTDGLGSIIGLSDSTGTLQTQYTYDPYGATTFTGPAASNSNQYTGRENDGTGLYYYRARYYSPTLQRFIGEDPLGFAGGNINLYSYVGDDPINYKDPFGLKGGDEDLGLGWSARVDKFNNTEGFEIHVFDRSGQEVGFCAGRLGWIAKHHRPGSMPPGMPEDVVNKLNGLNVKELRARNLIGERGTVNIKRGGYLNAGRTLFTFLNVLSFGLSFLEEYEEERDLEMRAKKHGRTVDEQLWKDSEMKGHPQFMMTPFGPAPNPFYGGRNNPTLKAMNLRFGRERFGTDSEI